MFAHLDAAKSTIILTFSNLVVKVLGLATTILLMRAFTPADYGVITIMISLMTVLPVFMDFGSTTSVVRFGPIMAEKGLIDKRTQLFSFALRLRYCLGTGFLLLGTFFSKPIAGFLLHDSSQYLIVCIALAGSYFTSFLQLVLSIFQSEQKFVTMSATF